MPPRARDVHWLIALGLVAVAGWAVRARPILLAGAFAGASDYDDAVNFSTAGLLLDGIVPYRDVFYAHPPGGVLALAPFAALGRTIGLSRAFALAGLAVTVVGALNVFLLGRLAWRAWGPVAGLTAATLYAIHPHALVAERTTFMEPLLNLASLAMANLWLARPRGGVTPRAALGAGVAAGIAVSFKAWALAWVIAALVALPRERTRAVAARFALGGSAALAAVALPFVLLARGRFLDGVVWFHLWRPPDRSPPVWRILQILGFLEGNWNPFAGLHAPTALLALVGLGVVLARRGRPERLAGTAYVLTLIAFMAGQSYYTHYNAHLALSETLLAGLAVSAGAAALVRVARRPRPRVAVLAAVAGLLVLAMAPLAVRTSMDRAIDDARVRTPENRLIGDELRRLPGGACIFAFEPVWTLSAGRLPPDIAGARVIADPYGAMLFAAVRNGDRFPSVFEAFEAEASQHDVRAVMAGCDYLVLGWRGSLQLSEDSEAWLRESFEPLPPGPSELDVWERRR